MPSNQVYRESLPDGTEASVLITPDTYRTRLDAATPPFGDSYTFGSGRVITVSSGHLWPFYGVRNRSGFDVRHCSSAKARAVHITEPPGLTAASHVLHREVVQFADAEILGLLRDERKTAGERVRADDGANCVRLSPVPQRLPSTATKVGLRYVCSCR